MITTKYEDSQNLFLAFLLQDLGEVWNKPIGNIGLEIQPKNLGRQPNRYAC
jgi:hypothetical protein